MSAIVRKSVTDLTRRKARTFFTVLTLALAVASVGIFAVPALMQQSMEREVAAHRLPDVTVSAKRLQISVAVATLLALLSLGAGMTKTGRAHFDDNHFDVWIQAVASKPLGPDAGRLIASTDGVRKAQAWVQNNVRLEGRDAQAWGLPARPLMNTHLNAGRWYTDAEVSARAKVAVLGATIAKTTGKHVGDRIRINTGSGPATLRVIGISGYQANNGDVAFTPVSTLQSVLGSPGAVNSYWGSPRPPRTTG
jgi:ABC-type lipoprotein release transport system permease subunit